MRIDREEKRSLKRLFVAILVMALLVTMLPFEKMGSIEARAEGTEETTSSLQEMAPFNADTPIMWVESYSLGGNSGTISASQAFMECLEQIAIEIGESETNPYPNGVIIKLGEDVDLEQYSVQSFFMGNIGIDLNGYSITNIKFYEATSLSEVTYDSTLVVASAKEGSVFEFFSPGGNIDWNIYQGQKLVFDGVDVQNVNIFAQPMSGFGINGFYHDVTSSSEAEECVYYYSKEGLYRTKIDYTKRNESSEYYYTTLYVEDLYLSEYVEDVFDVYYDASWMFSGISKIDYSQQAVDALNEKQLNMQYDNEYFVKTYQMPTVPFSVDTAYGVYSLSEDQNTITLYALESGVRTSTYKDARTQNEDGSYNMRLEVYSPYTVSNMEDGEEVEKIIENVIYAKGAIPQTYSCETTLEDGTNEIVDYKISEVMFSGTTYEIPSNIHFQVDASEHTNLKVLNGTPSKVSYIAGEANNEIWVGFWNSVSAVEGLKETNLTTIPEPYGDQMQFAKQGDACVVTLEEGYCLSNIYYGVFGYDSNSNQEGLVYEDDRRVEADDITINADGSISFKVPNYTVDLLFDVAPIEVLEDMSQMKFSSSSIATDKNGQQYHTSVFDVSGATVDYQMKDLETGALCSVINESVEGTFERRYYMVDVSTEDIYPSSTYGKITYVDYAFALDVSTPTITSVVATDPEGTVLTLKGGWKADSADTVWTKQPSITLTATADGGDGFPVAGYKFGSADWQTENTYTIDADGVYDLEIHVRDEFDVSIAEAGNVTREEAGVWKTSIGIDTTAPTVLFTDAKTPTQSALKSDASYEGNLHLVADDGSGSGIAEMTLYKMDGENKVAANDLLIKTESGSYIAPTTEDVVYHIELTDNVGNKTVYDNITVVGYTQDISVSIENVTTTYGTELSIPLTVTNTSEQNLTVSLFVLREDATDAIFDKEIGELVQLVAGETFTTAVNVSKGDAATYYAMLDIQYTNEGGSPETTIAKVLSRQIRVDVEKAEGTGKVSVADHYYGETASPTIESSTNGTDNVTLYYKDANDENSLYVKTVPTEVGTYDVKAVFAATTNYEEVVVESTFTITRMQADDSMYVIGTTPDEDGIYKEDVVIKGVDGNLLCTSEDGTFAKSLKITKTTQNYSFYVKTSTGAITEKIELGKIEIDKTKPEDSSESEDTQEDVQEVPPVEEEEIAPTAVGIGRVRLEAGKAYTFGEGSWTVSGDSTSYAGGITFYVSSTGDFEISQ